VKFRSDSSGNDQGFRFKWTWVSTNDVTSFPNVKTIDEDDQMVCGGVYMDRSGVITSPGFPSGYPVNVDCVYKIQPPTARNITLTFTSFDLEPDNKCIYDYVEIKDGFDNLATTVGRHCGASAPGTVTVQSGGLWLRFKSDSTDTFNGFKATWRTAD